MSSGGGPAQRLTSNAADDNQPVWSPDGTQIAFVSLRDGEHEIYVMDADGLAQKRLTRFPGYDVSPQWVPDGSQLPPPRET